MKYHDMPIPEDISKLNVNILNVINIKLLFEKTFFSKKVNRNKRYQDMLL